MKLSPDALALEAAKQWAMEQKIPTENCSISHAENGDLTVSVQNGATITISKREVEQFAALVPQFVGERLMRAYRKAQAANSGS
jgi:hypothetical protein